MNLDPVLCFTWLLNRLLIGGVNLLLMQPRILLERADGPTQVCAVIEHDRGSVDRSGTDCAVRDAHAPMAFESRMFGGLEGFANPAEHIGVAMHHDPTLDQAVIPNDQVPTDNDLAGQRALHQQPHIKLQQAFEATSWAHTMLYTHRQWVKGENVGVVLQSIHNAAPTMASVDRNSAIEPATRISARCSSQSRIAVGRRSGTPLDCLMWVSMARSTQDSGSKLRRESSWMRRPDVRACLLVTRSQRNTVMGPPMMLLQKKAFTI